MTLMQSKDEIRRRMKAMQREFLASGRQEQESERILGELERSPEFVSARTVLGYMAIPGEVLTEGFIRRWSAYKRMLIPLVTPSGLELREYRPDCLVSGYAGIPEPSAGAPLCRPDEVDFAFVPGVAFSRGQEGEQGRIWRLGRGKACYDRLLPSLHCPVAGVAFPFRLVDRLPLDPWDRPLDLLFI